MLNYAGGNPITAYNLTRSLRFRASASAYLSRTPASAGNRQKWTWSGWVKRGKLGAEGRLFASSDLVSLEGFLQFNNNDTFTYSDINSLALTTTQVFRDPSAWYHIVVALDTTQAVASDRAKIYVNGSQVTSFSTATYPAQNSNEFLNQAVATRIGSALSNVIFFDGYLAEVNFIDGQALTPSSFGSTNSTTGVWQPAKYTGTYGTNGFYLPFTDNSALTTSSNVGLGKDFSGNGNYWTTNNISITSGVTYDSMTDVPTLTSATAANFAVLNPLTSDGTISNANLTVAWSGGNSSKPATIGVTSGKWYCELLLDSSPSNAMFAGIIPASMIPSAGYPGSASGGYGYFGDGQKYTGGAGSAYGAAINVGDIVGIAFDADNGKLWFSKNGVWQASGDPAAGTNAAFTSIAAGTWFLSAGHSGTCTLSSNFGQRPFAYTPPSGFVALNAYNLPTATILDGSKQMDAGLYTGDGTLSRTLTGLYEFQPDFIWAKNRSGAFAHVLQDSVRGFSSTRKLSSNTTDPENSSGNATDPGFGYISGVSSTGFSVATTGGGITQLNQDTAAYVAWAWKANGAGVTNTNGTITSTVSVNASAGFSILTYTGNGTSGATVGHGLGVTPSFIYTITRSPAGNVQQVYHSSIGGTGALFMNSTQGTNTASAWWNNTSPTSSVFTLGSGSYANGSGSTMVAYCFAPIAGYSAFGSYTGNGSADGPFVYCGFRPKYVVMKDITVAGSWDVHDSSRNPYNTSNYFLQLNGSATEYSVANVDLLSNGFKLRTTDGDHNTNGYTYIYMAFAENPFKNSLAR